ncbi:MULTISPECIES: flagellar motor switch protein FliM [Dehalobacter]|jgi:flagellar motor switch protein FliM|uniref:Flagellar motor switch protein FliM n=2 Tax=Dehalobacter restrictus TaxID=55583 RepID=A0A857DMA5_9FIRM|nr:MULTISPECIES: flagellar motor switch protein FliM [Dehalobacter]AHF10613.1 flagellar motor switch protein FliM [Dehalobacter restrictus DSM 9455]MCG1026418.1 flagellar motor switch protein FliM [Dehalobacter sp.]MDJ0305997.1 flagellar motor switch protein FliM [Dehalobacter sp.]OCZ52352.1 flagellar motor switch protein FliM [Dehalobacter sp. TeCB1]QHA01236.1 flagellar motor switch protein FliM [Dehalobacter restrictus]
MGEVLSQAEIDALLNALSDGSVDEETIKMSSPHKIKVYDFKRPNKFSKGQLNSLLNIHENFCRSLATFLAGNMHTAVDAKVLSTEQVTYDEFIRSLPYPTILGIFSMPPLEGNGLLELSPSLAFILVDRLLGGHGAEPAKNRDLTEIERKIIVSRLGKIVQLMGEAWAEIFEGNPQLVNVETNSQFTQIVASNEMVVVVTMEVKIEEQSGMINVCLPYIVMKPILEKLNNLLLFSSGGKVISSAERELIRQKIEWAKVPMKAIIGKAQITIQDLINLERGDVIPLNQGIKDPLSVYVGEYIKFKGMPGLFGNKMAVQITEVIKKGGNEDG